MGVGETRRAHETGELMVNTKNDTRKHTTPEKG
jgi:hypothetical protein